VNASVMREERTLLLEDRREPSLAAMKANPRQPLSPFSLVAG
jgi:hypothetical protein